MRICVIFNPSARGEKANRFRRHLEDFGRTCALKLTRQAGDARRLATEAIEEGCDTVIAAGGDGTVNEVLNGIGDAADGFARARLGVLPVGTVNVFARELGIPLGLRRAWETLLRGREQSIDLPRIELAHANGRQSRYFIQMAGAGWDARAVEMVDWKLKKRIGQFAYMVAGLKALKNCRPLTIRTGSTNMTGELVVIGNGRFYGGQIPVFDRANLCDGLIDVCVFPKINVFVLFRYLIGFVSRRFLRSSRESYLQVSSLTLESATRAAIQLDGENAGHLPAHCSIQKQALRVLVPESAFVVRP